MNRIPALNVVCIMHGGFPVRQWLFDAASSGKLFLTLNDPGDHAYPDVPPDCVLTRNREPLGFAENVNASLRRIFDHNNQSFACVVNFDLEMPIETLGKLISTIAADQRLGAVAARLYQDDGKPIFSVGSYPTPLKEFLRAAGLRSGLLFNWQRAAIRRTKAWTARNAVSDSSTRILSSEEYLPWTCLVVRKDAWCAVGELDERFPLYGEDIDWSLRCHSTGWALGLVDGGRVLHEERATHGRRSDALYEYSHLELHRKWGWDSNLKWQKRGLSLRRRWPLRVLAPPLDWPLLTRLRSASPDGPRARPVGSSGGSA